MPGLPVPSPSSLASLLPTSFSWPVSFGAPFFLVLLLVLPAFYVLARRRGKVPRGPWPASLWLRLGVATLLILSLAGLRLPAPAKSVTTVFVLDQSESIPADIREGAKNWVRDAMGQQGPDDRAGIVTFGGEAKVELPLGKARDHPVWGEPPAGQATDVGAALELAADLLPPAGSGSIRRIVLLSDGNETRGSAQRTLQRPQLQDVEVAVLGLPQRLQDTALTSFVAPPALRDGEPAELRLAVTSPIDQQGRLRISANGQQVSEQTVDLPTGPSELTVPVGDLAQGFWAFHAELAVDGDSRSENNESWAYTVVREPARVLLVEDTPGTASEVRRVLTEAHVRVDTIRSADLSPDPAALAGYDSVVLANVSATALGRPRMEALQRLVSQQGKGLIVIGGDQTFGLGDYADTPLEETLPVTVQPPDRDQVASLALVLVIDRSGSMAATDTVDRRASRLDLAKEGAILAVETLKEGDQAGVVAFDTNAQWIAEIQTLGGPNDVRNVGNRISTIQLGGGTDFVDALSVAYRGLLQSSARVKHVILLTDGEAPEAGIPQLLAAMRRAGITVSTLGVSNDISGSGRAVLERIARTGQGRSYFTNTPNDVPRIMTQEARLAGRSYKEEHDFKPRLMTAAPAVRGLVPTEFPDLHGYVRTSPKRAAEVVLASDQSEPILAEWQYGLGRALVWTSDAQGPWAQDWASPDAPTDAFRRLWTQAVRWTMPAPANPDLRVSVTSDGATAAVRVESFTPDGDYRNLLQTAVDASLPDGSGQRIPLPQTAPGHYEGTFPLSGPGVYALQVTQTDDAGNVVASETTGYALPYPPEYAVTPANRILMERLAAETGGPVLDRPSEAWRRDTRHALQPQDVWREALALALVLFVADVAVRRLRPGARDVRAAGDLTRRWAGRLHPRRWPRVRPLLHPLQAGRGRSR
jgi:Mg-chelatase subunit ChlD